MDACASLRYGLVGEPHKYEDGAVTVFYQSLFTIRSRKFLLSLRTIFIGKKANMSASPDADIKYVNFDDLDKETQLAIKECIKARELAYCPYSNFKVGAALLSESGVLYTGCNVENASYSPSICAERTAVVKAVSSGEKNFKAIAISGQVDDGKIISPCGVCRQVLAEFSKNKNILVYLTTPDMKKIGETSIKSLLPLSFSLDTA